MPGPLAAPTPERLPEPRRLGQGLYLAPLEELPGCAFFPRHHYATVALSSGDAFFLLGGSNGRIHLNDIWFARLCNIGGKPDWAWSEVSEHQDGRRDPLDGQLMLSKFPGRSRFAAAGVLNPKGGTARALYVTGGQGAFCPEDFWASEDGGRTWYCMCRRVPWGGRLEPGLCVVPTKYEQVVVLGGIVPGVGLRVERDLWISADAGSTWNSVITSGSREVHRCWPFRLLVGLVARCWCWVGHAWPRTQQGIEHMPVEAVSWTMPGRLA
ncbi:HCN2 [Symbiodinium sp. CCMP2456]|nr:HCN2 [Symbiodinium sp. CCMP2456]